MMIPQQSKLNYSIVDAGLQTFDRAEAFKKLLAGLKIYKPDAKLIYATVGEGMTPAELLKTVSIMRDPGEEMIKRIDYVFVFEYIRHYKDILNERMYWVECPMLYSPKSLNTFMYYKKRGRLQEFFADYMGSTQKIKPAIFNQYLEQEAHLDSRPKLTDPKTKERIQNPNYWKLPENSNRMIEAITKMSTLYREK